MLTPHEIEELASEPVSFSYTAYVPPGFKRNVIDMLEKLGGRERLESAYLEHRYALVSDPWATSLSFMGINVEYSDAEAKLIPLSGPLIVIANHPYGALDGIVASDLIHQRRDDLKVVANSVLTSIPAIRNQLISIDFSGTRQAARANLNARKQAVKHVREGGALLLFPAGGVSTSRGVLGQVSDLPWSNFTAKLILAANAPILPVYFPGANTGLFQFVSQFSLTIRLGLLMRELSKRMGTTIRIRIGSCIMPDELKSYENLPAKLAYLRERLYALESGSESHAETMGDLSD